MKSREVLVATGSRSNVVVRPCDHSCIRNAAARTCYLDVASNCPSTRRDLMILFQFLEIQNRDSQNSLETLGNVTSIIELKFDL